MKLTSWNLKIIVTVDPVIFYTVLKMLCSCITTVHGCDCHVLIYRPSHLVSSFTLYVNISEIQKMHKTTFGMLTLMQTCHIVYSTDATTTLFHIAL